MVISLDTQSVRWTHYLDAEPADGNDSRGEDAPRSERPAPEQRVHAGHDRLFVLEGRICLWLGERKITIETGEAAEFATMTPHAISAIDNPAELIMIFDRDGQRAHSHHGSADHPKT